MKLRHEDVSETAKEGCKGSAARSAEAATRSRLREIAAAGAVGIALLFSSGIARAQNGPDGGAAPQPDAAATAVADAGSEEAAPVSAPASQPAQAPTALQGLPGAMAGAADGATNPANATDPAVLTTNLLRMFQLRDLMTAPPAAPAEGQQATPERQAYDAAISTWGNADAAITAIDAALVRGMRNLGRAAQSSVAMGADADAFLGRLDAAIVAIGGPQGLSWQLDAAGNTVQCLRRMMRGGQACTDPTGLQAEDRTTVADALPPIEMIPYDFGSQFFLTGFGQGRFIMADPQTAPEINLIFGSEGNAQNALNEMRDALEVLTNSPNDPAAQANAARELYNALSRIPHERDIWNSTAFNNAMTALNRGDLRGGLNWLSQETTLNGVWSSLGNLNQVTLSQRAVARIRAGFQLRFPEGTNPGEFLAFRRSTEDRPYAWDVLYYSLGANYTNLLMSGRLQAYSLDMTTFRLTPSGPARMVEGTGHAWDGMAGITFGGTMLRQPVEATLSARLGYLMWKIEAPDARGTQLSVDDGTMYGMLNFDVNMVGYEARTNNFRLSRWGIGMFNLNPHLYFTLTGRSYMANHVRLEHSITPQYMLFWGRRQEGYDNPLFFQNRVGADLRPLDVTIQQGTGLTWYFGPGLHYTWNTEQGIHSFEPYGHASLRWARGGLAVDARVGYLMDAFGESAYHVPRTVTGTFNLILTPAAWFSSSSSGSYTLDGAAGTGGNK